jgi:hypothetical protein
MIGVATGMCDRAERPNTLSGCHALAIWQDPGRPAATAVTNTPTLRTPARDRRRHATGAGPASAVRATIRPPMSSNPKPPTSPAGDPATAPVMHGCVRCGAPVAIDVALCDECNPLGLADPASSQVHGTAILGIAIAVVIMAVVARMAFAGVGPFVGDIVTVEASGDGLAVTLMVTNQGTSAGATTCVLNDPAARYGGANGYAQSPRIGAGQTVTFTTEITQLGSTPRLLAVQCSAP